MIPASTSHLPAQAGTRWALTVQHTWDGDVVGEDEAVALTIERAELELTVRIDAPFHDDPPPDSDDLWKYEVVELMLVGADDTSGSGAVAVRSVARVVSARRASRRRSGRRPRLSRSHRWTTLAGRCAHSSRLATGRDRSVERVRHSWHRARSADT